MNFNISHNIRNDKKLRNYLKKLQRRKNKFSMNFSIKNIENISKSTIFNHAYILFKVLIKNLIRNHNTLNLQLREGILLIYIC